MDTVNVIENKKHFQDCAFINFHIFDSIDKSIPVYEVKSIHGLNQIIGYLKYNNNLKNILYRGETKLHADMKPTLYRKICSEAGMDKAFNKMGKVVNEIIRDDAFCKYVGFDKLAKKWQKRAVCEALLQHYGVGTSCLDVVDNHWVALWFGLHKGDCCKKESGIYLTYKSRICDSDNDEQDKREEEKAEKNNKACLPDYQYIIMFASEIVSLAKTKIEPNVIYAIDLRAELPSMFIRPHAQHGLLLRARHSARLNYADNIVGIVRIRTDRAAKWLGDGELLKYDTLFPSPVADFGYDVILKRTMGENPLFNTIEIPKLG